MKRKLVSLTLVLCMVLGLFPIRAFANDTTTDLEALNALADNAAIYTNGVVTLEKDYDIGGESWVIDRSLILDLNGHTIQGSHQVIVIENGYTDGTIATASFTLKDSKGGGKVLMESDENMTESVDSCGAILYKSNGKLTIQSGSVEAHYTGQPTECYSVIVYGVWVSYFTARMEMTGGKIEASSTDTVVYGVNQYNSDTNISGGSITARATGANNSAYALIPGDVTALSNVDITAESQGGSAVAVEHSGMLTVSDDTTITATAQSGNATGIRSITPVETFFIPSPTPTSVTIKDGSIAASGLGYVYGIKSNEDCSLTVAGGRVSAGLTVGGTAATFSHVAAIAQIGDNTLLKIMGTSEIKSAGTGKNAPIYIDSDADKCEITIYEGTIENTLTQVPDGETAYVFYHTAGNDPDAEIWFVRWGGRMVGEYYPEVSGSQYPLDKTVALYHLNNNGNYTFYQCFDTMEEAVKKVYDDKCKISLNGDATGVTETLTLPYDLTIELNGHTISGTADTLIYTQHDLTVTGGTLAGKDVVKSAGEKLTLRNITVNAEGTAVAAASTVTLGNAVIHAGEVGVEGASGGGNLNIYNTDIEADIAVKQLGNGDVDCDGGSITATTLGIEKRGTGTLSLRTPVTSGGIGLQNSGTGAVVVYDDVTTTGATSAAIHNVETGTITLMRGTVTAVGEGSAAGVYLAKVPGTAREILLMQSSAKVVNQNGYGVYFEGNVVNQDNVNLYYAIHEDATTGTMHPTYRLPIPPAEDYMVLNNKRTYSGEAIGVSVYATGDNVRPSEIYYDGEDSAIDVGDYTITIDAPDGEVYRAVTGFAVGTLTIAPRPYVASEFTVTGVEDSYTFTGSAIQPEPILKFNDITLVEGIDYALSYGENTQTGSGTIAVTLTKNFTGSFTITFPIGYDAPPTDIPQSNYLTMPQTATGWYEGDEVVNAVGDYTIGTTNIGTGGVTIPAGDVAGGSLTVYVKDSAGNIFQTIIPYQVDTTAPVLSDIDQGDAGWTRYDVPLTFAVGDATSGIASVVVTDENNDVIEDDARDGSCAIAENGTYTITVTDRAGNSTVSDQITVANIDKTAPIATIHDMNNPPSTGWYTMGVTVYVTVSDDQLTSWEYTLDDGTTWQVGSENFFFVEENGDYQDTIRIRATDQAGNVTESAPFTLRIDKNPPFTHVDLGGYTSNQWSKEPVTITLSSRDGTPVSGGLVHKVSVDGGNTWTAIQGDTYTIEDNTGEEGINLHFGSCSDAYPGNPYPSDTVVVKINQLTSEAFAATQYEADDFTVEPSANDNGWHNKQIEITVNKKATVGAGGLPATTYYTLNNGEATKLTGNKITIDQAGSYSLSVWTEDASSAVTLPYIAMFRADGTAPVVGEITGDLTTVSRVDLALSVTPTDELSGINTVTVTCGETDYAVTVDDDGVYTFMADQNGNYTITATDKAGNQATKVVSIANINKPVVPVGKDVGRFNSEGLVKEYDTLSEAFSDIVDGDTIVIYDNLDLGDNYAQLYAKTGTKSATLELNGHTITSSYDETIYLSGDVHLTVKDSVGTGGIENTSTYSSSAVISLRTNNCSLTVEGGTLSKGGYNGYTLLSQGGSIVLKDGAKVERVNGSCIVIQGAPSVTDTCILEIQNGATVTADNYAVYFSTATGVTSANITTYFIKGESANITGKINPIIPEPGGDKVDLYDADGNFVMCYSTLSAAVQDTDDYSNATLKVTENISVSTLTITSYYKAPTIDLNGCTVTGAIKLNENSTLTIKDSSEDETGTLTSVLVYNGATLNLESGNIVGGTVPTIQVLGTSTVNISGGTVSSTLNEGYAIKNVGTSSYDAGTINISGGLVTASGEADTFDKTGGSAIYNTNNGVVNLTGGTVSYTNPSGEGYAIHNKISSSSEYGTKVNVGGDALVTSGCKSALDAYYKGYHASIYMQGSPSSSAADKIMLTISDTATVENTVVGEYAVIFGSLTAANVGDYYTISDTAKVGNIWPAPLREATAADFAVTDMVEGKVTVEYDGDDQNATVTNGAASFTVKYYVQYDPDKQYNYTNPKNPGTYDICAAVTENAVYKAGYVVLGQLVIEPKPITITANDQNIDPETSIATGIDNVTVTGDLVSGHSLKGIALTLNGTDIVPSAAEIKDSWDDEFAPYYDISYENGTLAYNKIDYPYSITLPQYSDLVYGQTLSESLLTGGSSDGTFAWKDGAIVPTVEAASYTLIFTPNNTDYNPKEVTAYGLVVAQAVPTYTPPAGLTASYGDTLKDVTLPTGFDFANGTDPVGNVGENNFTVTFTPEDADNYKTVADIAVVVSVTAKSGAGFVVTGVSDQAYTGQAITFADLAVVDGATTLISGTDYDAVYSGNTDIGTATITITCKGNYSGTLEITFQIDYAGFPEGVTNDDCFTMPEGTWYKGGETLTAVDGYAIGTDTTFAGVGIPCGTDTDQGTLTVYVKQNSSGSIYKTTIDYQVDATAPTLTDVTNPSTETWSDGEVITFTPRDAMSTVDTVVVKRGETVVETTENQFTATENGEYIITVTDKAGNETSQTVTITRVDTTAPIIEVSSLVDTADTTWHGASQITITLTEANPDTLVVKQGEDDVTVTDNSFTATSTADYTITATDLAGNQSTATVAYQIEPMIDEAETKLAVLTADTVATASTWYEGLSTLTQYRLGKNARTAQLVEDLKTAIAANEAAVEAARAEAEALKKADEVRYVVENATTYTQKQSAIEVYEKYIDEGNDGIDTYTVDGLKAELSAVDSLIDSIKNVEAPYDDDRSAIEGIRADYDEFSSENKALFDGTVYQPTYTKLITLLALAEGVEDDALTADSDIKTAKANYDSLSEDAKALVTSSYKNQLDSAYDTMLAEQDADAKAVTQFEVAVAEAKATPTVAKIQGLVATRDTLTATPSNEADYNSLVTDLASAQEVLDTLETLDEAVLDDVKGVIRAYNAGNDTVKTIVDAATHGKIDSLDEGVTSYESAKAAIDALPESPDTGDSAAIEAAKAAYTKVTTSGRKFLTEADKTKLDAVYDALMEAMGYQANATAGDTEVEVAGLSDKVDLGDTTGMGKVTVTVVAEATKPDITPTPTDDKKEEVLTVGVSLMARYYADEGDTEAVDESKVQPSDEILLTMKLPTGYVLETMELWHVAENGMRELLPIHHILEEEDGLYAVFAVSSFSHFVFFAEKEAAPVTPPSGGTNPSKPTVTVTEEPVALSFVDVSPEDWFYESVAFVYEQGLMLGTSKTTFEPQQGTTRGMLMTILARVADVDTTGGEQWYSQGMDWAVDTGVSDGTDPTGMLTREQLVTMLHRYATYAGYAVDCTEDMTGFVDVDSISDYALIPMQWAIANGIIAGRGDGILDPNTGATRAEMSKMLMAFLTLSNPTDG